MTAVGDERWWLVRSNDEPRVWPFGSFDEAADFQAEHGLIDWRVERLDTPEKEHQAICSNCGESWPCRHQKLDQKARIIISHAAHACDLCGKQMGYYPIRVPGGGLAGMDAKFCGRKGSKCERHALRLLREAGHDDLAEKHLAAQRERCEWLKRQREAKAQRREVARRVTAEIRAERTAASTPE